MEINSRLLSKNLLLGLSNKIKKVVLSMSITVKKNLETTVEKYCNSEVFKLLVSEYLYMLKN